MIGYFLELSVNAPDILASLAFYESLGFKQADGTANCPYPYAVVTDGRVTIGLHQRGMPTPTFTFVCNDLARQTNQLATLGLVPELEKLGVEEFNEVVCHDAFGWRLRFVEARTFSPVSFETVYQSQCGYFVEYGLPVKDIASSLAGWERLGLIGMEPVTLPFERVSLTSDHLNVGLMRSRALRHLQLIFEDDSMALRLDGLRKRGYSLIDEMPDSLDEECNGVLVAPEGTRLLLMQEESASVGC